MGALANIVTGIFGAFLGGAVALISVAGLISRR